jgi:hypothetical protein
MTMNNARILSIISGLIIYTGLVVLGIYSIPMPNFVKENILVPWSMAFAIISVYFIWPNRIVTSNGKAISNSPFWVMILYPIIIGCIGFLYIGFKHTVVGISWIFVWIAISIGLSTLDLYRGKGAN